MPPRKFTAARLAEEVSKVKGWKAGEDSITKTFKFKDHVTAMGFVTKVGIAAEVMNHHPDLRIVYNTVDIKLNSHDAGGVTGRDIDLATRINELA